MIERIVDALFNLALAVLLGMGVGVGYRIAEHVINYITLPVL